MHIVICLDRSGSMLAVKKDTEGGLRAFIEEQKGNDLEAVVSLYQFDTIHEAVYRNEPLSEVHDFVLQPRGGTALLDAIGLTVADVRKQYTAVAEDFRPKVVLVVLTDGEENSSQEYSLAAVKKLLTDVQEEDGWSVLFLGADQDAFTVAASMGVGRGSTLSYASTNTSEAWQNVSNVVTRGATSDVYSFTEQEQDEVQ